MWPNGNWLLHCILTSDPSESAVSLAPAAHRTSRRREERLRAPLSVSLISDPPPCR
jgi:hypothetical protein